MSQTSNLKILHRAEAKNENMLWYESGAHVSTSGGKTVGQKYGATVP
jgi:hypothetical protein